MKQRAKFRKTFFPGIFRSYPEPFGKPGSIVVERKHKGTAKFGRGCTISDRIACKFHKIRIEVCRHYWFAGPQVFKQFEGKYGPADSVSFKRDHRHIKTLDHTRHLLIRQSSGKKYILLIPEPLRDIFFTYRPCKDEAHLHVFPCNFSKELKIHPALNIAEITCDRPWYTLEQGAYRHIVPECRRTVRQVCSIRDEIGIWVLHTLFLIKLFAGTDDQIAFRYQPAFGDDPVTAVIRHDQGVYTMIDTKPGRQGNGNAGIMKIERIDENELADIAGFQYSFKPAPDQSFIDAQKKTVNYAFRQKVNRQQRKCKQDLQLFRGCGQYSVPRKKIRPACPKSFCFSKGKKILPGIGIIDIKDIVVLCQIFRRSKARRLKRSVEFGDTEYDDRFALQAVAFHL